MNIKRFPPDGFVKRLNNTILEAGDDYKAAAGKLGVGFSTIYAYMQGDITPSIEILCRICTSYHVTSDWLLFGEENNDSN